MEIYLLIAIACCFLIAKLGNNRKIGYWKLFFVCLLLSPLVGLVVAILNPLAYGCLSCNLIRYDDNIYCPRCGHDKDQKTIEENIIKYSPKK